MAGKVGGYIVFDFETGGFDCKKNACTEIGLIFLDGETLEEVGRYESYIQPYIAEYEQAALDFTGVTVEKLLEEGKPMAQVGKEIFDWIKDMRTKTSTSSYTKKPWIVGHNVLFDIGFLQHLAKQSKTDIFAQIDGATDYNNNYIPKYIDTIVLAKLAWGNDEMQANFKLETCVGRIGSEVTDAHKAINDVIGTKDLLAFFTGRMRSEGGEVAASQKIRPREGFHFNF